MEESHLRYKRMSPARFHTRSAVLTLLLALAACGGDGGGGPPPTVSRTLAYVVTECHEDARGGSASQRLLVVRGAAATVTVAEIPAYGRLPALGLCPLFGTLGNGLASVFALAFQRLGVSPDGSSVVFEVTFENSLLTGVGVRTPLTPEQEGIYHVRADGSGLRRLGHPSREPAQRVIGIPTPDMGVPAYSNVFFSFSPDGRSIAFADRGPGPAGEDAAQVVILDLATGLRRPVTRLPDVSPAYRNNPALPSILSVGFKDDATIGFFSRANPPDPTGLIPDGLNPAGDLLPFTVKTDGTGLSGLPKAAVLPGSRIVPVFSITQPATRGEVVALGRAGTPVNPTGFFPPEFYANGINEVFLLSSERALQLTNFRRTDTNGGATDGQRVFFVASADPFGTNPSENCQIFSVDILGTDLRQLTEFRAADHSAFGCLNGILGQPGCFVELFQLDRGAATVVFASNCDPLGTNPNGGEIFVMSLDGTELRQLTTTRGLVTAADGSVDVELPGPFVYAVPF